MEEAEKARLVAAWIEGQAAPERSELAAKNWWAIEAMFEIPFEQPELAWELILRIHAATDSEEVRTMLAAGPIEDLMEQHGAEFIERVETFARRDPLFRRLLAGVWLSESPRSEWQRFYKAANIEPFPWKVHGG